MSVNSTQSGSSSSVTTTATANSPVSFAGLSSGIDTSSIITKLTQAEQDQVTIIQNQQTTIQTQLQTYQTLGSGLTSLSTAAGTLATYGAFALISGTSSNTATASITAAQGANAGNYSLSVTQLAKAQKLASAAQSSSTTSLGLGAGSFTVDGKAVQVTSADSLTSIAQKVNTLNNGVTASIIDGGQGNAYITLTAGSTGTANQIQLADVTGSTLSTLGITTGSPAIANPQTNGALSYTFSSSNQTLSNLTGLPSTGSYSFSINGGSAITVNPATDTLQSVANNINAAGGGVSATVNTVTNGSTTGYQLSITSTSGSPTFSDTNNLLAGLGVLQSSPGNQLVQAKDAKYSLDGVALTSSSNTITSAIPGATLTLLQGNTTTGGVTSPSTSTLSLSQNTTTIVSNINSFVSAFNAVTDYINQNSTFDSTTKSSGSLFGDAVAEQVQSDMSNMIFANVPGTKSPYTNLASIGFTFNSSGDLTVDSTALTNALQSNPSAVSALFQSAGTGSTANLAFESNTSKSVPTGTGSYAVNVTQSATREVYTAPTAQTTASTSSENLNFSGGLFGGTPYVLALPVGATLDSTVAQINSDSTLKSLLTASNQGGYLSIQSNIYGGNGNFTVLSSAPAAANNSGVGTSGGGYVYGVNVQGTINGELATGSGQFLTGNSGNKTTDGLEIQYIGTSTGNVGAVTFNNGMAVQTQNLANSLTNAANGLLSSAETGLTKQITDLGNQITSLNTDLANQTSNLQAEFANMESAIADARQQSSQLSSLTNQTTTATGISV